MAARSLESIRRDVGRLRALVADKSSRFPALASLRASVDRRFFALEEAIRQLGEATSIGNRRCEARYTALAALARWARTWRPAILVVDPRAAASIRALPPEDGTPDEILAAAKDLVAFLEHDEVAGQLRSSAMLELGDKLVIAEVEVHEANRELAEESNARARLVEAKVQAKELLGSAVAIVRALFGPRSREYEQFVRRAEARARDTERSPARPG